MASLLEIATEPRASDFSFWILAGSGPFPFAAVPAAAPAARDGERDEPEHGHEHAS